ncbi:alpha/beta-hydrolase [Ophiobolus disseminans]|uniref:feruloyl esterase n=1 Tax=Ophiobolus disseminans TaxID=1469910 RepID=A0A6A6ZSU9_9PLEO|nr:alpha/beta-hydrolase [Ophiobolus disseminans]
MKSAIIPSILLSLIPSIHSLTLQESQAKCNALLPPNVRPDDSVDLSIPSSSGVTPRKFRLHLPPGYDGTKQLPLILSFHGRKQNAIYQEKLSQFSNASYGFKGIVVYPEGVPIKKDGKEIQQWQGDPEAPSSINDLQFTMELLKHLKSTYCIDPSRIYAAGKSNGGGFTGMLACDPIASTRIAAFAAVSGAFYINDTTHKLPDCLPGRHPVPLMEFHGLADRVIKYAGGPNKRNNAKSISIVKYVDDWAKRDGFTVSENSTSTPCSGKKEVTKYAWGGEKETVVHYAYKNLDHDWPSSFANKDTGDDESLLTCKKAEATSLILEWFGKWTL